MSGGDLLVPGAHRATALLDDAALVEAMLAVEVAWTRTLADAGAVPAEDIAVVRAAAAAVPREVDTASVEGAGNPVLGLLAALRGQLADREAAGDVAGRDVAARVHRGLTSQDVLDTALMLIARDALAQAAADLWVVAGALGALADRHRGTVMAGRTLTQHAVPTTFGLKAAQWLVGVVDAVENLEATRAALPVQCGGAAGTLSKAATIVADPSAAADALAGHLGLAAQGLPWHTRRTPVTRLGDACAEVCDALGKLAVDVLVLGRPEIGELREVPPPGGGGSSTMPHKQNPVLGVLLRSASLQAPPLAATLHACAASAVDERPDGAWHAEWPTVRRLLTLTTVAASQAADLVTRLEVDAAAMTRRAEAEADALLAERGGGDQPVSAYVGVADRFVTAALARLPQEER